MSRRLNLNLKDRMEEINERFQLKTKASVSNDLLEGRLANIRKKMNAFAVRNEQELATLRSDAQALLGKLETNNQQYEREAQAQLKELEQLSQALSQRVESEVVARREKESQLVSTIERRLRLLRGQIEKERAERTEVLEQVTATLRCDVPSLMNEVLSLAAARRQEEEKIGEVVEGELEECELQAQQFRAKQQENCAKVFALIRELTLKAKREVEEEKAIREETHDEILSYVEETCNRLAAP